MLYVPKLRQFDLGDMMFKRGEKVRMAPGLIDWVEETIAAGGVERLRTWLSWANETLEVVRVGLNQYDPDWTDVAVKPVNRDVNPLVLSIDNETMVFCNDTSMIPFVYADGSKYSRDKEDCCKKCGSAGRIIGMACVCSKCGQLVWGI